MWEGGKSVVVDVACRTVVGEVLKAVKGGPLVAVGIESGAGLEHADEDEDECGLS